MINIKIGFNGTDKRVIGYLTSLYPRIIPAVMNTIDIQNLILQQYIVTQKLSGQVLKHRTGKLAASVNVIPARMEGTQIVGNVIAAGGPAWYGKIHEYGGTFTAKKKFKSYTITFPERSFMRSSFAERRAAIIDAIRITIANELAKK